MFKMIVEVIFAKRLIMVLNWFGALARCHNCGALTTRWPERPLCFDCLRGPGR